MQGSMMPQVGQKRAAVFLDRDGVLIRNVHYLCRPDQLELLPGAAEAVRRVNEAGHPAILVTNQSVVARGMCTETMLEQIHDSLRDMLAREGAHLDAVYHCPHHPDFPYRGVTDCPCRKPAPGMLHTACRDFDIDPVRSVFVGDSLTDVEAAVRAGVRPVLVAAEPPPPDVVRAWPQLAICGSLLDAVCACLAVRHPFG